MAPPEQQTSKQKLNVALDLRVVSLVLLAVIIAMLLMWRPWDASANANDRTVTVTGQASLKAVPDEYIFYPTYSFDNPVKSVALSEASKKSDELTGKLKALGVKDHQIQSSTNGGADYRYSKPPEGGNNNIIYTLQLTVTVNSREMAQKVQDYLTTTEPAGSVSPHNNFSTAKRKELESRARDEATKEARSKADQSAKNLGFRVGKVQKVEDGTGFGGISPLSLGDTAEDKAMSSTLQVQPGQNDLNYSITVTYYVK